MAQLKDVIAYLCSGYPYKQELSKARTTKMIYLADWLSAIKRGIQITDIKWVYDQHGPYVKDVIDVVRDNPQLFSVETSLNMFGEKKELIKLIDSGHSPRNLSDEDVVILDYVIHATAPKSWSEFIKLVYSTYPVIAQSKFASLNLVELAKTYKQSFFSGGKVSA